MLLGFDSMSEILQTLAGARTSSIQSEIKKPGVGLTEKWKMMGQAGPVVYGMGGPSSALLSSPREPVSSALCHHQVLL